MTYKVSGIADELAVPILCKQGSRMDYVGMTNNTIHAMLLGTERVLSGNSFIASVAGTVANNASMYVSVSPSETVYASFEGGAGGDSYAALYEAPAFSGGTVKPLINKNRESSSTLGCIVKVGVTPSSTGLLLMESYIYGGQKSKSGGGSIGTSPIFVLKAGVDYLVQMQNISGDSTIATLIMEAFKLDS